VANAYTFWRESDPFDVGGTIRRATDAMIHARQSGTSLSAGARAAANLQSEANGALMRQSPLALWGIRHTEESLDRLFREDTALTHPNRVCQDASAAFIVALSACIREGLDGEATYQRACSWDHQYGASPSITSALSEARRQAPNCEQNQGHVLIALQNAFYQLLNAPTFQEGVVNTVMAGGDTDTNGAIAGALLRGTHGVEAIRQQWSHAVLTCRPEYGSPGVTWPRPQVFWPVDALDPAKRLVCAEKQTSSCN